jgi:hypothetical protein
MSDTSSRDPGEGRIIADFDQTNGVLDAFEGESGGTAAGESRSAADREEDGGGGGVLDDLHDGRTDPYVDDPNRMGSTADDSGAGDPEGMSGDLGSAGRSGSADGFGAAGGAGRRPGTAVAADADEHRGFGSGS